MHTKGLADIYQTAGRFSISAALNVEYLFLSLLEAKWPQSVLNQVSLCILMLYHTLLLLSLPWRRLFFNCGSGPHVSVPQLNRLKLQSVRCPRPKSRQGLPEGHRGSRSDRNGHHPNCLPHHATAHKQCRVPTPPACVFLCV